LSFKGKSREKIGTGREGWRSELKAIEEDKEGTRDGERRKRNGGGFNGIRYNYGAWICRRQWGLERRVDRGCSNQIGAVIVLRRGGGGLRRVFQARAT